MVLSSQQVISKYDALSDVNNSWCSLPLQRAFTNVSTSDTVEKKSTVFYGCLEFCCTFYSVHKVVLVIHLWVDRGTQLSH